MSSIPNLVTLARLLGIPFLLYLIVVARNDSDYLITTIFFIFLAITDALDGWLARKLNAVSDLGKLLDPLVDKLLVIAPLIILVGLRSEVNGAPLVPAWMVVLVVAREVWITGLRGVAASNGVVVAASDLGKIKTILQVTAVALFIYNKNNLFEIRGEQISAQYLGLQCLMFSIVISYWGAFEYTWQIMNMSNKKNALNHKSRILKRRAHQ